MKYGYWTDLASLHFDDQSSTTRWIQAMPLGQYDHPIHGQIDITPDKVKQFAQNVKDGVRGQDLDIDYDHKANGGEAAGWVKDAEARPDGLWLLIEWTKDAFQKLKDKAYRYFSPEYNDEWTHPKTGQKHQNVLFGGAITNRPFLKDILAINMSELIKGAAADPPPPTPEPSEGGTQEVDGKELRAKLGLKEDATEDEVNARLTALTALTDPPTPPAPTPPTPPAGPDLSKMDLEAVLKSLTDLPGNPAVKTLTDLVKQQHTQMAEQAKRLREIEVDRQLDELDRGKKFSVPPVVKERLREVLLSSAPELGRQVFEAYQQTLELGLVDMTEKGWQRRGETKSPTDRFLTEVDQIMADAQNKGQKVNYAQAAAMVAAQNPQLAEEYRQDSYIPAEGR